MTLIMPTLTLCQDLLEKVKNDGVEMKKNSQNEMNFESFGSLFRPRTVLNLALVYLYLNMVRSLVDHL